MKHATFSPAVRSWSDYQRVYRHSLEHSDEFWASVADYKIQWRKRWDKVSAWNFETAEVSWYVGAELNVSENCLDRHVNAGLGDKTALIWVGNSPGEERKLSYRELLETVCQVAHGLTELGVRKGDRVVFYLPNIPELAIGVLACARIGAIHSVIFGGFSAHSIHSRIDDCGAKLVITADETVRGTKHVLLKPNVDEALSMGCPSVEKVIVVQRGTKELPLIENEISWDQAFSSSLPRTFEAPAHSSEDPLFILYTSGSTGKPKGVLHTMGGYLTYAAYTHELVFQPEPDDVYWCTADMGWITGHSYMVYGPLANGVTTVMFEGVPTYPNASRFWEVVDRHQVNIFYSSPTAIRTLAGEGDTPVKVTSRSSLRILGTVGEPINPEAWKWYNQTVGEGRCPIVDTWWQTETGGIMISPLAGISETKPGSASFPLPGVEPRLLNEAGEVQEGPAQGALVLARSWPGQMRGVNGEPHRFHETYFSQFKGYYFTGDGATRDEEGFYRITGRMDDVIQVAGHRLGSAEIESACVTHPDVTEAAAVGIPDPITGEALHVFVALRAGVEGSDALAKEVIACVRKEVGPLATPKQIHWAPGLPKTRSGKIMRRILRKIALSEFDSLGDISSLADPSVVQCLVSQVKAAKTPQTPRTS